MIRKRHRKKASYKALDHTADLGFDVYGATRKELFRHAALALFDTIAVTDTVKDKDEEPLAISGTDRDDLWINYLRELLYLFNGKRFLVHTVDILTIGNKNVSFIARGEPLDLARHEILTEIKAVTYHQAHIKKTASRWTGRFIVDV